MRQPAGASSTGAAAGAGVLALSPPQLQAAMAASQQRLNDSVMNCVRDLNAVMGYDAILFRESGVYFNPELDVCPCKDDALAHERLSGSAVGMQYAVSRQPEERQAHQQPCKHESTCYGAVARVGGGEGEAM